jgi:hypothetical protein
VGKELDFGNTDVNLLSNKDVTKEFKVRQETRTKFPGLCSWNCQMIVQLVIKHIFGWNEGEQKSTGMGPFGELEAWTLATEEQGRKSLHGHFLLFVRNWNKVLTVLQRRQVSMDSEELRCQDAVREAKDFHNNACSAKLFADFQAPEGPLSEKPVFHHSPCAGRRKKRKCGSR